MEIAVSAVVAAVGAGLRWGVAAHGSTGFNLHTAGIILLLAGISGVLISIVSWQALGGSIWRWSIAPTREASPSTRSTTSEGRTEPLMSTPPNLSDPPAQP